MQRGSIGSAALRRPSFRSWPWQFAPLLGRGWCRNRRGMKGLSPTSTSSSWLDSCRSWDFFLQPQCGVASAKICRCSVCTSASGPAHFSRCTFWVFNEPGARMAPPGSVAPNRAIRWAGTALGPRSISAHSFRAARASRRHFRRPQCFRKPPHCLRSPRQQQPARQRNPGWRNARSWRSVATRASCAALAHGSRRCRRW